MKDSDCGKNNRAQTQNLTICTYCESNLGADIKDVCTWM